MDRDHTLRKAEKLLRQGRLEAAIAEYALVVEDQPRDWATANTLGDLYVRAGQIDKAVGQYVRIAEHLAREGFTSRATALYKKIVKIHPDDDTALLRAAELAAQQGLTADARVSLQSLFQQRLRRADRAGAAKIADSFAALDPADASGRVESARMLSELGDQAGAAAHLRAAGQILHDAGKLSDAIEAWRQALRLDPENDATSGLLVQVLLGQGDPDAARDAAKSGADWRAVAEGMTRAGRDADAYSALDEAIRIAPADVAARVQFAQAAMARHDDRRAREALAPLAGSDDPLVQFALAEAEFRSGEVEAGRSLLLRCLAGRDDLAEAGIDLGCAVGPGEPAKGLAIVTSVVEWAESSGDTDRAIDALGRFLAAVPRNIAALEELVRVCGQRFYENQEYRAQIELTEVYLDSGKWPEARSLAEHLLVARPDDADHAERLARALTGLGVPNPDAVVRAYVRRVATPEGLADFATLVPRRTSLAEDVSSADRSTPPGEWVAAVSDERPAAILVPPDRPDRGPSTPLATSAEAAAPVEEPGRGPANPPATRASGPAPAERPRLGPSPPPMTDPVVAAPAERPWREPLPPPAARAAEPASVEPGRIDEGVGSSLGAAAPSAGSFEIDLSGDLDYLTSVKQVAPARPDVAPPVPAGPERAAKAGATPISLAGLEAFFHNLREQAGPRAEGLSAAVAYDKASEHYNRGEIESAVEYLRVAARDPLYRFRAASMLARFARDEQRLSEAVEWLEQAADAPAPTIDASHGLLYELGDTLEAAAEETRALAVFIELQSVAPGYRDVGERIANLSPGQPGRRGPGGGSA